ncbi:MAG: ABC transporter permease [Clostridiales bacterium]|nr:ABC transporter permease [Clostridiales bacterium]
MKNFITNARKTSFHISKRSKSALPTWKAWTIRIVSVIISLVVCSLIIVLLTGQNPLEVYSAMIKGSFGSERKFLVLIQNTAILLGISLAVTPAFKMKFWNLGAEGQVLIGGLCCMVLMFKIGDKLPNSVLIITMLISSILGGIAWGLIPAIFKAKWNTNESLFTLMMNYIAIQLVSFAIMVWVPSGSSVMGLVNASSRAGWLPDLFGKKYIINIITVAVLTAVMYVYLKYSKHGYEISVVGESENTAKYIGINVKKVILRTMIFSGALCGLVGFLLVAGTNHTISKELAGGNGFTAIMVSWLAKFNPITMVLTSFLIAFLQKGAGEIATSFNLNTSIAEILTGIIIFFIIGSEFFINYEIKKTKKEAD